MARRGGSRLGKSWRGEAGPEEVLQRKNPPDASTVTSGVERVPNKKERTKHVR